MAMLLANSSCSDSRPGGESETTEPGETALLAEAPGDRLVVAEVDGIPVYADCVEIQAAGGGLDARSALEQCIDFELLAQEAQRRGKLRDPEVIEVGKVEAVRRFIDADFYVRVRDRDSIDEKLYESAYQKFHRRFYRPEYRHTVYIRVPAKDVAKDSAEDRAARALADEIYRALEDRRGLTVEEVTRVAVETAGERTIEIGNPFNFPRKNRAVESFAAATFAIPEAGMVSVPTRTQWGWDVILLTKIAPEKNIPLEEAKSELFEYIQRQQYVAWMRGHQKKARIDHDALERLQQSEDARRFAPGSGSP